MVVKIKKLSFTNIGGCGGSIYRSQRRSGVAIQVQYSIHPKYPTGACLYIRLLKKGTVGSWIDVEHVECADLEQARVVAQLFDDFVQSPEFTDEELEVIQAAEEVRTENTHVRFTEGLSRLGDIIKEVEAS